MARLQSQRNLMYVPTPAAVVDRLRPMLDIPDRTIVLDPCCGTGEAVRRLAPGARIFGIELEVDRAAAAARVLDRVLVGASMQDSRVSHGAFGMVFLNPPYDHTAEGGRLELVFLERCTRYLRPGGVLVYIIKESQYTAEVVRHLARNYADIAHWRFPDPYFNGPELDYGQTILVARRAAPSDADHRPVNIDDARRTIGMDRLAPMPPVPAPGEPTGPRWTVPAGAEPSLFLPGEPGDEALLELLRRSEVRRRLPEVANIGCGRPPLPLGQGHIALVLASGLTNGVFGSGPSLHVAKGTVRRTLTHSKIETFTASGAPMLTEREQHSFAICIRLLTPQGRIIDVAGAPAAAADPDDDTNGESADAAED